MNQLIGQKKILLILISVVLVMCSAFSYAWFSSSMTNNGNPKDVKTATSTLQLSFIDGPQITLLSAYPGDSQTKTFTVKNTGSLDTYYKINWKNFNNTITKDELAIFFECNSFSSYYGVNDENNVISGTCDRLTEEAIYNKDIKNNIKIEPNITHEYSLTIKFLDIKVVQNYNQGTTFSAELQVLEDTSNWIDNCSNNNSLRCTIIKDNLVENNIQNDNDINFAEKSSLTNGQGLYRNTKIGDGDNYYFRGGNYCAYTNYLSESISGTNCSEVGGTWTNYKCSLDYDKTSCESKGFEYHRLNNNVSFAGFMWQIIRIDENGNVRLLYNGTNTTDRGELVQVTTAKYNIKYDDNAYAGYMQPNPTQYYVSNKMYSNYKSSNATNFKIGTSYTMNPTTGLFTLDGEVTTGGYTADNIGKYTSCSTSSTGREYIVRIDEVDVYNGTNRITKATVYSSVISSTKEQAESNDINSLLKTEVDNWYRDNIENQTNLVKSKISTSVGFCNDRRTITNDGGFGKNDGTYAGNNRIFTLHTPVYKCSYESNDLFTVENSEIGNGKLTYPVGIITSDELAYSGNQFGFRNYIVYTHSGQSYWTLSPASFLSDRSRSAYLYYNSLFSDDYIYHSNGVRPVIALNETAIVNADDTIGGDGSLEKPYIIE